MTRLPALAALLPALMLCAAPRVCADDLGASASVDKARITIGDVLTYTVAVSCPAGTTVKVPDATKQLAPFEVRDSARREAPQAGRHVIALTFQLVEFEVGEREVGGLRLECTVPGSAKPTTLKAPPVKVTVASVLPPDAQDIKDIRGPVPVRMTKREWLAAALLILGLLALIGAILYLIVRRRRARPKLVPLIVIGPGDRALAELDALGRSELARTVDLKPFYIRLSEIVREYLEAQYSVPAMEQTTWMIARDLAGTTAAGDVREGFVHVLRRADLVKFAREHVEPDRATVDLADARGLVVASRPAPDLPGKGGEAAPAAV